MRKSSRGHGRLRALLLSAALGLAACKSEPPSGPPTGGPTQNGPPDDPGNTDNPVKCAEVKPGPQYSRRLTNAEYESSLQALTGGSSPLVAQLPADGYAGEFAFNNHAAVLRVSTAHAEAYALIAEKVAADVMASAARREKVLGCSLSKGSACLESFIKSFGRRAYRRPLTDEELASLRKLATAEQDPAVGAALALQAMLQSPHFLYRVELGAPSPERTGFNKLNGFELATRLSFLLLGQPPDDTLLDLAASGGLDTAEGVAQAARGLLAASPQQARESVRTFYSQWLSLQRLDTAQRTPERYPAWSPELRDAMREEVHRVFDHFIWEGEHDFLGVLTARHTYVNPVLARFYGLTPSNPTGWGEVRLEEGGPRGGLLTLAGLLTVTADHEGVAPILRGKFVRMQLLCKPPPPVPDNVPTFPEAVPGESDRDRLARHRKDPSCSGCHNLMDPIGFGLEQYDAIGAFRTKDSQGHTLTAEGSVMGMEPADFRGPAELAQRLRASPDTSACVVKQVFRWASGRYEQKADACTLERLTASFRDSGHDLPALLVSLTSSDAFRYVDPSLSLSQEEEP
jgi:hypothetical protein